MTVPPQGPAANFPPPPGFPTGQPPVAPRPEKKRKKWPWIVGGVVALLVVVALTGNDNDKKDTTTASDTPAVAVDAAKPEAAAPADPTVGVAVRDGKFEFTVTSVDRSKTAGDPSNQYLQETAQGEFINVHMTVRNIGDKAQTYFDDNQKLAAGGGKQYSAASVYSDTMMEELNPGLAIDAVVSFDVPVGAQPESIILHDSALSRGVKVALVHP